MTPQDLFLYILFIGLGFGSALIILAIPALIFTAAVKAGLDARSKSTTIRRLGS